MNLVVGLGNPGEKYVLSKHNAGRIVLMKALADGFFPVDRLAGRLGQIVSGSIEDERFAVLFPDTYMNESGRAVAKYVSAEEIKKLIVVYDDVDLPVGEFKVSFNRGDGGHNGVASVVSHIKSKEFVRIRIGVAKRTLFGKLVRSQGKGLANYVLSNFSKHELAKLEKMSEKVKEALVMIAREGVEKAMNKFN